MPYTEKDWIEVKPFLNPDLKSAAQQQIDAGIPIWENEEDFRDLIMTASQGKRDYEMSEQEEKDRSEKHSLTSKWSMDTSNKSNDILNNDVQERVRQVTAAIKEVRTTIEEEFPGDKEKLRAFNLIIEALSASGMRALVKGEKPDSSKTIDTLIRGFNQGTTPDDIKHALENPTFRDTVTILTNRIHIITGGRMRMTPDQLKSFVLGLLNETYLREDEE